MTLILQIVLGLLLLVGLATIIMSSKNWHWTQLTLVLLIFFSTIGFLFLGAETWRIHRNLRKGLPRLEKEIARFEQQNDELVNGAGDEAGILALEHQLRILTRERGRVWRGVVPAGQVDQQGRVSVDMVKPSPHGLEKDAIIFAFEAGNPNAADPASGAQYLGEFRVTDVQEAGATLEPVLLIDNRMGKRLAASEGPWSLYDTMPIDRHRLFADLPAEALQELLPAESVEEYLRHGESLERDSDEWNDLWQVTGLDAEGKKVGTENIDQAVKRLYDRNLRDYAFIFNELAADKVVALAKQRAIAEDNARLVKALVGAKSTGQFRQQQIDSLDSDLTGMKRDRAAIESHLASVQGLLDHFQERIEGYLQANSALATQFTDKQLGLVEYINRVAPAPARSIFTGP